VWFGVLGPLEVRDGEGSLRVSSVRQRTLLAALLGRPGHVFEHRGTDRGRLERESPGHGDRDAAQSRHGPAADTRAARRGGGLLARYPGYLIDVGEHELDATVFTAAVRAGRRQRNEAGAGRIASSN